MLWVSGSDYEYVQCNRCTQCTYVQRYLAHKKQPPPQDHHRVLGIVLLKGPRGALLLMSEVPLYGMLQVWKGGFLRWRLRV